MALFNKRSSNTRAKNQVQRWRDIVFPHERRTSEIHPAVGARSFARPPRAAWAAESFPNQPLLPVKVSDTLECLKVVWTLLRLSFISQKFIISRSPVAHVNKLQVCCRARSEPAADGVGDQRGASSAFSAGPDTPWKGLVSGGFTGFSPWCVFYKSHNSHVAALLPLLCCILRENGSISLKESWEADRLNWTRPSSCLHSEPTMFVGGNIAHRRNSCTTMFNCLII